MNYMALYITYAIMFALLLGRAVAKDKDPSSKRSQDDKNLEIVQPYPRNYIVIEGNSLTFPCAAGDSKGYPRVYIKKQIGESDNEELTANETVSFRNTTYNDTKRGKYIVRIDVTLSIVRYPQDGIPDGQRYFCYAISNDGRSNDDMSFLIYVIKKSSLPRAFVSGTELTPYGAQARLNCNVTFRGDKYAPLKKIMWKKRNLVIKQSTLPTFFPLFISKATTQEGGDYACVARVLLINTNYKEVVLDTSRLNVGLKMLEGTTKVTANVTDDVVMECPAEGYPLNVTWYRVNRNGQETELNKIPRIKDRISVYRPCSYCRYMVKIHKVELRDEGHFVCKANTNIEEDRHHLYLYVRSSFDTNTTTVKPTTYDDITAAPPSPNGALVALSIVFGLLIIILLLVIGLMALRIFRYRNDKIFVNESDSNTSERQREKIDFNDDAVVVEEESPVCELHPLMVLPPDLPREHAEGAEDDTSLKDPTIVDDGILHVKQAEPSEVEKQSPEKEECKNEKEENPCDEDKLEKYDEDKQCEQSEGAKSDKEDEKTEQTEEKGSEEERKYDDLSYVMV